MKKILLNITPKIWSRKAYVQSFGCEKITKIYGNMFEHMKIVETIYQGIVECFYKNITQAYANCAHHNSKRSVVAAPLNSYCEMISHAAKCKKRYKDHLSKISKPTCLIYDNGHYSECCKVLKYFGTQDGKIRPSEESGHEPQLIRDIKKPSNKCYGTVLG